MFSPNKSNSPLSSSFEQPVFQNQRHIKSLQSKYLSDQYQKLINNKMEKQQQEKLKKRQQLQMYNRKKQQYLSSVATNRMNKMQQKQYMSHQYEDMINIKKQKAQQQKRNEKLLQKNILGQRSWIRDAQQERQLNKIKTIRYNQQLQMHVKAQEQRIRNQQQKQKEIRDKINMQAQQILNKQYQQLQQKQRRKNMFEQRQNQLLGTYHTTPVQMSQSGNFGTMSNSRVIQQMNMKKRQQQLYGIGLQIQRQNQQQQRKRKQLEQGYKPGQVYNPITNPLPVVYKNPNVLKMLYER